MIPGYCWQADYCWKLKWFLFDQLVFQSLNSKCSDWIINSKRTKTQAVETSNFWKLRISDWLVNSNDCLGLHFSSALLFDVEGTWSPSQTPTLGEAVEGIASWILASKRSFKGHTPWPWWELPAVGAMLVECLAVPEKTRSAWGAAGR